MDSKIIVNEGSGGVKRLERKAKALSKKAESYTDATWSQDEKTRKAAFKARDKAQKQAAATYQRLGRKQGEGSMRPLMRAVKAGKKLMKSTPENLKDRLMKKHGHKLKNEKVNEGQKRLHRVGNAMIKARGFMNAMDNPDKAMRVQFRKEKQNEKEGDARNTPAKLSGARRKGNRKEFMARLARRKAIREDSKPGLWANIHAKRKRGEKAAKPGEKGYPKTLKIEAKSPAWQRKAGKNPEGGLNQKGVASYRAANPGSKLKTAVTTKPSKLKKGSKAAARRKSFCARMSGMKKRLTSKKTANDPDSRINKSLRKWNC